MCLPYYLIQSYPLLPDSGLIIHTPHSPSCDKTHRAVSLCRGVVRISLCAWSCWTTPQNYPNNSFISLCPHTSSCTNKWNMLTKLSSIALSYHFCWCTAVYSLLYMRGKSIKKQIKLPFPQGTNAGPQDLTGSPDKTSVVPSLPVRSKASSTVGSLGQHRPPSNVQSWIMDLWECSCRNSLHKEMCFHNALLTR